MPGPVPFRSAPGSGLSNCEPDRWGAIVNRLCRSAARDLGKQATRRRRCKMQEMRWQRNRPTASRFMATLPVSPGERTAKAASAFPESTPNPGRRNFAKIAKRLPRFDLLVWCHRGLRVGETPRVNRARSGTKRPERASPFVGGGGPALARSVQAPLPSVSPSPFPLRPGSGSCGGIVRAESGTAAGCVVDCRGLMGVVRVQEQDSRPRGRAAKGALPQPRQAPRAWFAAIERQHDSRLAQSAPCSWFREIGKYEKNGMLPVPLHPESHRTEAMSGMEHCRSWTRIGLDWVPGACPSAACRARVALPRWRGHLIDTSMVDWCGG